nr:hypothetical protein [Mycobacterium riyadhense]
MFPVPLESATLPVFGNGTATVLAADPVVAQLSGTDNVPRVVALPTSADTTDIGPPSPAAEPSVLTSPATGAAKAVDELSVLATELTDDIADIDELIVEAAELAGDSSCNACGTADVSCAAGSATSAGEANAGRAVAAAEAAA